MCEVLFKRLETVKFNEVIKVAIGLEDKKQIVSEVNQAANSALSAVLADYHGVDVADLTALRKIARENKVYLRVVRNTLLRKAVAETEFECIQEVLVGPTILAFSQEDPGAAARVLKDFAKENDEFEIKALSIGGKLMEANQIDVLAKLPTLDQARSMLMSVMLAPITKLTRTVNEVPSKVTRAVAAVRDQKQEAA
jgi:large subunit ribosomal protein L10|tara:strand:+ start:2870 stop:3457 length:588 start_codon:yes stop_codon:yes gene_type:complete